MLYVPGAISLFHLILPKSTVSGLLPIEIAFEAGKDDIFHPSVSLVGRF
jgi:hypothetical protein